MTPQEINFWDRLNNLRLQIFRVKLARLETTMPERVADMQIDALTELIRNAR